MEWLSPWNKRIKLSIDGTKITGDLTDFPLMVKLSSAAGINQKDVTDIITTLTTSGVVFSDDCSGGFINKWEDKSNGDSYSDYNSGKLRLQLNGGGDREGVNVLSKSSFETSGKYIIEFDWYPADSSVWYDDDNSDAKNQLSILCTNPTYNTGSWQYNEPEYASGTNSKLILALRSNKSNKISCLQRLNGLWTTLINENFTYGNHHYVKWVINFDTFVIRLYIDDQFIGSSSFDSTILDYIGTEFKLNFHWHTYSHTGTQYYDNIKITHVQADSKKFIVTTNEHTPCYTEIEHWTFNDATLWVKVPTIASGISTVLYFYYDGEEDNDTTVGYIGEVPATQVWDDNYLCVYHLSQNPDNDSANAIKDSTSNANHGTSGGGMKFSSLVDAKTGRAIKFDGSDDYIHIAHNIGTTSNQWIMEYLFKSAATSPGGDAHVFWDFSAGNENGCGIYNYGNNLAIWSNGSHWYEEATNVVYDDKWHYNVHYWDGTDCYHILDNSTPSKKTNFGANWPNSNLWFGRRSDGNDLYTGALDEVRISKIKRSNAYIKATYYTIWDELITYGDIEYRPIYYIDGYVKEDGLPVKRLVRLYYRLSGELVDTTTSSGDGYYRVITSYSGQHFVVVFDDDEGEEYNALIADRLIPRAL